LAIGAGFVWVARKATTAWVLFLTNLMAIQAGLTAFSDLFALIELSSRMAGAAPNDARAMSELTLVPALVWAVLWALVALALIGAALWRTWLAPKPVV
jgi:Peptidase M50B-like